MVTVTTYDSYVIGDGYYLRFHTSHAASPCLFNLNINSLHLRKYFVCSGTLVAK